MTLRFTSLFCLLFFSKGIASDEVTYFEKHIRPALIEHCFECHSEGEKVKGGLLLDRREGWKKGGDSGPAIVPPRSGEKPPHRGDSFPKPRYRNAPKGKLPDSAIAHFEEWIRQGAADPRDEPSLSTGEEGIDIAEGKKFWSFQPVSHPPVPEGTSSSPIDRFIDSKLAARNLSANGPTTPEMRIRRAKTDLTGLLPTVAEQDEFLSDPSDETFAGLVDRWLADEAFGERWGRVWLDLARYADTSGGGRAMPLPEAWRFRDFVIEAFAEGMPLDELIRLHIAGDLLPYGDDFKIRERNLVATGFLVLGPHNYEKPEQGAPRTRNRRRTDRHDRALLSRYDDRLRPLPRSQVRSDSGRPTTTRWPAFS